MMVSSNVEEPASGSTVARGHVMADDDTRDVSEKPRDLFEEAKVRFPEVPTDENPEDSEALRLIVTGQEAQRNVYEFLAKTRKRDSAFLVRMLRRDWEKRFPALIAEGRHLLARFRGIEEGQLDEFEACPSLAEIEKVSTAASGGTPLELLEFLAEYARRAFVCGRLIPWKAEAARVFKFFADCVEAEDHHMALLIQLANLVGEE